MDTILNIYFKDTIERNKLIVQIYLIIMISLITNKLLNFFSFYYVETEITLNKFILFLTSGQILILVIGFVFCYFFFTIFLNIFSALLSYFFIRIKYDKRIAVSILSLNIKVFKYKIKIIEFIEEENGIIYKGKEYNEFIKFMDILGTGSNNGKLFEILEIINPLLLSTWLALYSYGINIYIPNWIFIIFTIYVFFFPINLAFFYFLAQIKSKLIEILLEAKDKNFTE